MHSYDDNVELMRVAQKYSELINYMTQNNIETVRMTEKDKNIHTVQNPDTYLSLNSNFSKVRAGDDQFQNVKVLKNLKSKFEKLSKNVKYVTMSSSVSPNKLGVNDAVKIHSSEDNSLKIDSCRTFSKGEKANEIKLKHKKMIEKALKYH